MSTGRLGRGLGALGPLWWTVVAVAAGCAVETPGPGGAAGTEAPAYRGDALIVRVVADAARAEHVPRDLLLALGFAESHLVPRAGAISPGANDAEDPSEVEPSEGEGARCGLFGLDEGSARDQAAQLIGVSPDALCESADIEARAAAARLRVLAGGDDAPPIADIPAWLAAIDKWHPLLDQAGFRYSEYMASVLAMGFDAEDELGEKVYLPPDETYATLEPEPELASTDPDGDGVGSTIAYSRPDTPLAVWRGSCDYTPASRRPGDVRFIVIHTCEGGYAGCISTLISCGGTSVSAHYVTSYTGHATQTVEENDIAWHATCVNYNSIGIEHEGWAGASSHPDAQYCKTARIVAGVASRWRIPIDRSHIIGHVEANRLYCHGSHWDPGPGWDWTKFMRYVREGCTCSPHTEVCDGRDNDCDGRTDEGVRNACGTCGAVPTEVCDGRDNDCDGTTDENVCDRAAAAASDVPTEMDLGSHAIVNVRFRNAGTTTWRPASYSVIATGDGATAEIVDGGIDAAVAPGASVGVKVEIVPTREGAVSVTVGVARDGRRFRETWTGSITAQRPPFAASFVDMSMPASMQGGETWTGFVVVKNEGRDPWPSGTRVSTRAHESVEGAAATALLVRIDSDEVAAAVAPGEQVRLPVVVTAGDVRVETMAEETIVVKSRTAESHWPEDGHVVSVGLRPSREMAIEAEDDGGTLGAGCAVAAPGARGLGGGLSGWALVFVALGGVLVVVRRRRRALALGAALVAASAGVVAGCSTTVCGDGATCGTYVDVVAPSSASARGGDVVVLTGDGLDTVTTVRFEDAQGEILARSALRLEVAVPPGKAGPATIALALDDGRETLVRDAFEYEAIEMRFTDATSRLPEDDLESREGIALDFDSDGDIDVFYAARRAVPRYLVNDGGGDFELADASHLSAPSLDAIGAAGGDVDGDGDADVVLAVYGRAQDVLLRNKGGALGVDPDALPSDASSDHAVVLADFDGDKSLDLAVAAYGADAAGHRQERVLLNDGTGQFTAVSGAIPARDDQSSGIAAGDVNRDGHVDLVTTNDGAMDVAVRLLLGDGTGHFVDAEPGSVPEQLERARRPLLGDLDADGDLDLVALGHDQDRLYLNDGGAHFFDATYASLPVDDGDGNGGALADLDLDGDLDLVIANGGLQDRLYLNDGTGRMSDATLALPEDVTTTRSMIAADFDANGAPDLFALEGNAEQDRLLLGSFDEGGVRAGGVPLLDDKGETPLAGGCSVTSSSSADGGVVALFALLLLLATGLLRARRAAAVTAAAFAVLAGCTSGPEVSSIAPEEVSARGGDMITITGARLDEVGVRIADQDAEIVESAIDRLLVRAPRAVAGLADVLLVEDDSPFHVGQIAYAPLPARFSIATDDKTSLAGRAIVLEDIDGDDDLDALVAVRARVLVVYENDGGKLLRATKSWVVGALTGDGLALALGDLDGDGSMDAYVGASGAEDHVLVRDGASRLIERAGAAAKPPDAADTRSVALGDVDGDGDLDAVVGRSTGPRLLLNDGTARFAEKDSGALREADSSDPEPTRAVAVADFDDDGALDVLVANDGAPSRIMFGDGRGGFRAAQAGMFPETVWACRVPAIADLDADGDLDIALATTAQDVMLRNDGEGHFGDATRDVLPVLRQTTEQLIAADVDLDGDVDLVGAGGAADTNVLHLSDGEGRFVDYRARVSMPVPIVETSVAVGDIDGDGSPDVVLAVEGAPLAVLLHDVAGGSLP